MKLLEKKTAFIRSYPLLKRLAEDKHYRILLCTSLSLTVNIAYSFYNGFLGIRNRSIWFITMFVCYMFLSMMRLCAVRCRKNKSLENAKKKELSIMKISGVLLLFLTFALCGALYLTIKFDIAAHYHKIIMITIAVYTFYKIVSATNNAIKVRKTGSPLFITIRNIGLADMLMSVLSLQKSMLISFGTAEQAKRYIMNVATGSVVCGLVFILGLSMIITAVKQEQKLERSIQNGRIKPHKSKQKNRKSSYNGS